MHAVAVVHAHVAVGAVVLVGGDALALDLLAHVAHGVVGVVAGVAGQECRPVLLRQLGGRLAGARRVDEAEILAQRDDVRGVARDELIGARIDLGHQAAGRVVLVVRGRGRWIGASAFAVHHRLAQDVAERIEAAQHLHLGRAVHAAFEQRRLGVERTQFVVECVVLAGRDPGRSGGGVAVKVELGLLRRREFRALEVAALVHRVAEGVASVDGQVALGVEAALQAPVGVVVAVGGVSVAVDQAHQIANAVVEHVRLGTMAVDPGAVDVLARRLGAGEHLAVGLVVDVLDRAVLCVARVERDHGKHVEPRQVLIADRLGMLQGAQHVAYRVVLCRAGVAVGVHRQQRAAGGIEPGARDMAVGGDLRNTVAQAVVAVALAQVQAAGVGDDFGEAVVEVVAIGGGLHLGALDGVARCIAVEGVKPAVLDALFREVVDRVVAVVRDQAARVGLHAHEVGEVVGVARGARRAAVQAGGVRRRLARGCRWRRRRDV